MTGSILGAWNGSKALQTSVLKSIKTKIANGQLVHGTYGEMMDGVMKGCAVFITTCNSDRPHQIYEEQYGIPQVIARYEDMIFEHLSEPHDHEWPVKVAEAIKPGADLSLIVPKFQLWLMQETLKLEPVWRKQDEKDAYTTQVVKAIKQVVDVMQNWITTGSPDVAAAYAARAAAYAAVRAARAAAYAAVCAARAAADAADAAARAAADAAYAAVYAAVCAARAAVCAAVYAAVCAARAAARAAADAARAERDFYLRAAEKLLELLKEAPMVKEVSS